MRALAPFTWDGNERVAGPSTNFPLHFQQDKLGHHFGERRVQGKPMSESITEDHELFVFDADYIDKVMQYCIDRKGKAREERSWPLKYTDCVAIQDTLRNAPRAAQQMVMLTAFGTAYIKEINGVRKIVLKGYPGNRGALAWLARMSHLTGTTYGVDNPKVEMFKVKPLREFAGELAKDASKSVRIAFFLFVPVDVVEEILQDHWYLTRLGVRFTSDMVKSLLSAAAGLAAGVAITGVIVILAPEVAVAGVVGAVGAFAVSVLTGYTLEGLDQHFGLTEELEEKMMKLEDRVKERVGEKIDYWKSVVDAFERDVELTLDALQAARDGANRVKEYWDRAVSGIPELGEFVYRLQ